MAKREETSDKVIRALRRLERRGRLTPESVVEQATDPKDPLHPYFEWDNAKASAAYRLDQARHLIRSIPFVVLTKTGSVKTFRYVRDPVAIPMQGYVSMEQLRNEDGNARVLLEIEFDRAASALKRAENIAVALGLKGEIIEIRTRVDHLRSTLRPDPPEDRPNA